MRFMMLLFRFFPPEVSHFVALNALNILFRVKLLKFFFPAPKISDPFEYKGLVFKNKLGIAAGLDKNGDFIDSLGALGFGFIEIGTVTPLPQPGNPKPRIFRFADQGAIVNRLGFNNKGVNYLIEKVKTSNFSGILGINIGANKKSTGQKRIDDYVECFKKVSSYADYITVNISSPNTPNLRSLHAEENFIPLFDAINSSRHEQGYTNPIFIKLSPDESDEIISRIIKAIRQYNFDGVIRSNTTVEKEDLINSSNYDIKGGLSGKPLFKKSNDLLRSVHEYDAELLKIAAGGVFSSKNMHTKFELGASLVQIYTSFIFQGPQIVHKLLK